MRTVLFALSFTTAGSLLAAGAANVIGDWGDLTALAIVGVVLIFIVTKILPSNQEKMVDQSKAFIAASESLTKVFTQSTEVLGMHFANILDKMHERSEQAAKLHHEEDLVLSESLRELTAQCARRQAGEVLPPKA